MYMHVYLVHTTHCFLLPSNPAKRIEIENVVIMMGKMCGLHLRNTNPANSTCMLRLSVLSSLRMCFCVCEDRRAPVESILCLCCSNAVFIL